MTSLNRSRSMRITATSSLGRAPVEGLAGLQVEHHPVRQGGEAVVHRLVLALGDLGPEAVDQPRVVERHRRVVREHLEQLAVGVGEGRAVVHRHPDGPDDAGRALERSGDLLTAELRGRPRVEHRRTRRRRPSAARRRSNSANSATRSAAMRLADSSGASSKQPVASGDQHHRRVVGGREERELGDVRAEQLERLVQQDLHRLAVPGGPLDVAGRLVEAFEALVVAEQPGVAAVCEEQRRSRSGRAARPSTSPRAPPRGR